MFEVPSAKRVKRSQLFNSDDDDEFETAKGKKSKGNSSGAQTDDYDDDESVLPDYGFEYDFISPEQTSGPESVAPQATTMKAPESTDKESETYQFNLFAPSRSSKSGRAQSQSSPPIAADDDLAQSQPQTFQISIRSPSPIPEISGPGSLASDRPLTHYFTSALPPEILESLRTSYMASAIDSAALTKLSNLSWPGTHQSWRIITLPAHRKQIVTVRTTATKARSTTTAPVLTTEKPRHRARPSKKRRDLSRSRAQKRQMIIDETKTKEEHEKEKKNKKNRERKLKRRAKERREKEAMREGTGGVGGVEGSVSVDGSADD